MNTDQAPKKLASFWIGPLVAGGCLAAGYEVTQRIMIVNNTLKEPANELFQTPNTLSAKGLEARSHLRVNATTSVSKGTKFLSQDTDQQAENMQSMLDALEISWIDSKTNQPNRSSNQINKQKFSLSKNLHEFHQQTFDKLFKSLPAP